MKSIELSVKQFNALFAGYGVSSPEECETGFYCFVGRGKIDSSSKILLAETLTDLARRVMKDIL